VAIPAAMDLMAQGAKIIAVSDVSGAIYNPEGIDIKKAVEWTREKRFLKGLPGVEHISNEELIGMECDVFIPAAIDGIITEANMHTVRTKIIAEGANGPLTKGAVDYLHNKGVFIIPDILCNAGGVIVSYFEWVQGMQNFFWGLDEINKKLHDILKQSFSEVVGAADQYKVNMKTAALIVALRRLERAMKLRGLFPG